MNLIERLAQAQNQRQQIEQNIRAYEQEIQRLAPQLWAVQGRESLLIELVQEAERLAQEPAQPAAHEVVQPAQEQPE